MKKELSVEIVQSDWLEQILADPISKTALRKETDIYYSENGFAYSIKDKVPDFRIWLNKIGNEWQKGQDAHETNAKRYYEKAEADLNFYPDEQKRDAPMYERLRLEGRVLDLGGALGNIRKYMNEQQEYCSIDPFTNLHTLANGRTNLFDNYPMHLPLNLIAGFAEFLPFRSSVFDTANMRSCIDHFFNPALSLLETNRVLRENGKLIIGMTVDVKNIRNTARETIRSVLNLFTNKFADHHLWHPSRDEIITMCKKCGFVFEDEIWQGENVWYGSFRKNKGFVRIT
jgi:SAM-dependent methyltransferase